MAQRKCSLGCAKPVHARNLCRAHYSHFLRYGNPLEGKFHTGNSKNPLHQIWRAMIRRCQIDPRYKDRGISVCERWRKDFWAFVADMGPRPSSNHSVERIDNNLGYQPGNCRWATKSEQMHNMRSNRYITAFGRTQILEDWDRETGIKKATIWSRIQRGWTEENAVTMPIYGRVGNGRKK